MIIEKEVIYKKGKLWFEDQNCSIVIGQKTTIEEAEIAVAENNSQISIGSDCMLSSAIRISTTDSHSIIDTETNRRINPAQSVDIDKHVWIGRNVSVCKGVHIYQDSIIGANSFVTHDVPSNSVVAGIPARVIKEGVNWIRERM